MTDLSFIEERPTARAERRLVWLVFFMLASRFGMDQVLPLPLASQGGGGYQGAPRLVDVTPQGISLNGVATTPERLLPALTDLVSSTVDTVILRGQDGAELQRIVDVATALRAAGYSNLVLVE